MHCEAKGNVQQQIVCSPLGVGNASEMKPIFWDCKKKLILGAHGAERNTSHLFWGHGAEVKKTMSVLGCEVK